MMGRLTGKKAFITAAGAGIGRATALAFASEGADVIATSIDTDELKSLKAEASNIDIQQLDARDTEAIQEMAKEIGAIDVLFNCAGFVHHGTIMDVTEDDWDFSFDLNVKSMWRTVQAFLPSMLDQGHGSIINMSSGASSIKGAPNRCLYGATKAAVIGLTKGIAVDFAAQNIRCNAICPGTVETPSLNQRMHAMDGNYDDIRATFVARQPMGRICAASEIAMMAVFLASDESAFVTGAEMKIDGGWTL